MKILFVLVLSAFMLSGCNSINNVDKETYESLKTGINLLNKDFLDYVNNDKNISNRSKLTINTKVKTATDSFNMLKMKE